MVISRHAEGDHRIRSDVGQHSPKARNAKTQAIEINNFFFANGINESAHMMKKLFECPAFETGLSLIDLWMRPHISATFISSLPSFPPLSSPFRTSP